MNSPEQTEILGRLDGIERHLAELATAITGNKTMGHKGIVERLETLELLNSHTPEVHQGIEERGREARAKLHSRIDELEERTSNQINGLVGQWNRVKYTAAGVGLGIGLVSGASAAWITNLFG